jgi:hypothetical protein
MEMKFVAKSFEGIVVLVGQPVVIRVYGREAAFWVHL